LSIDRPFAFSFVELAAKKNDGCPLDVRRWLL
jgi:hypothetical protein